MADQHRVTEADIRAVLAGTYTPEGIDIWWNSPNRNLAGCAPAEVVTWGEAGPEDVLAEAERVAGAM